MDQRGRRPLYRARDRRGQREGRICCQQPDVVVSEETWWGEKLTYLVEVDVHTLKLKVGRAIVAVSSQCAVFDMFESSMNLLARAIEAVLARDDLPAPC
jgi:hypothetical protein